MSDSPMDWTLEVVILPVSEHYTEQDLEETICGVTRVARWFGEAHPRLD